MSIKAAIKSTSQILEQNLSIPFYQRPYRWTTENILQLLEDVQKSKAEGKLEYRIGSAIFYYRSPNGQLEIVDGQQRLTTTLLIATVAGRGNFPAKSNLRYPANSVASIRENYKFIEGDAAQGVIKIALKYDSVDRVNAIKGLKRVSRPGLRQYTGYKDMPRVLNGLGIAILSTSRGVMTNKQAAQEKIGGEVLCYVY